MPEQTPGLSVEGQIRNTLVRVCQLMDDRDFRGLADLFTEDGVSGTARGRDEIVARYSAGDLGQDLTIRRKHVVPNSFITFTDADTAEVLSDFVMIDHRDEGHALRAGRYEDELRRQADGRWLIAARRLTWLDG